MAKLELKDRGRLKSELLAYKRSRIVEEASHLFYELGYSGTTLDALADRLHVTKPFLYSYFKNKEAILAAICETGISESLEVLEQALAAGGTPRAQLIELVRRVGRIVIERQEHIVVYQREMKNLGRADFQRILGLRHEFDHRIAQLLRAGNRAGDFATDADSLVSVWVGGLISWIPVWFSPGGRRSEENVIDQLVDACLRMAGAPSLDDDERLESAGSMSGGGKE